MKVTISGFMGLRRTSHGDPRSWSVTASPKLIVTDEERGLYQIHKVVQGAITDGASVPRALWWFASPLSGRHAVVALFHDIYYATHVVDKEVADLIFYHGMLHLGVNKGKAWSMYQSVKKFGRKPYNSALQRNIDDPDRLIRAVDLSNNGLTRRIQDTI